MTYAQNKVVDTDTSSNLNYNLISKAYIAGLVATQALPKGLVPDDGMWAGQIWLTLQWYQQQTNSVLSGLTGSQSSKVSALVAKAKQYYAWYDFLDAYRFAKAAAA